MNGQEQRARRTVVDALRADVNALRADVETVLEGMAKDILNRLTTEGNERRAAVDDERTQRLTLAREVEMLKQAADLESVFLHALHQQLSENWVETTVAIAVLRRGFFGRLRWLVTGR